MLNRNTTPARHIDAIVVAQLRGANCLQATGSIRGIPCRQCSELTELKLKLKLESNALDAPHPSKRLACTNSKEDESRASSRPAPKRNGNEEPKVIVAAASHTACLPPKPFVALMPP
jgi:hypothetical protein